MTVSYLYEAPFGPYRLTETDGFITGLAFGSGTSLAQTERETPLLHEAASQLQAYFTGSLRHFTVPLAPAGTPFQQKIWELLLEIPYGETATYGQIARKAGQPTASRAVGMANHRNPIPIFIPCHRVVGSGGKLVGYAGGLTIKRMLLDIEQNAISRE